MHPNTNLSPGSPNATWSCEKATTTSTTSGLYRSRIYTSNININPLIAACDQLLSLVTTLKTIDYPEDQDKFLQDLAHEICSFEHRAQIANYPLDIVIAARYALCCLLDETITTTQWGQKNNWKEKNLLSLFHHEKCGDTRFFTIIEHAVENISSHFHLIELLYLCLNFGFTGKYRLLANGPNELAGLNNRLYQIIGQYGSRQNKQLLIRDEKTESEPDHVMPTNPLVMIDSKKLLWGGLIFAILIFS